MLDYDFGKLNDKEFEAFCIDLLGQHLDRRIERFKPGKDAGVDGRYFTVDGQEVILQCKHWAQSGVQQLIRSLKNVEVLKLRRLKPERYLLITSLALSRKNKADIARALSPWIKQQSDVFGREDLNDLLAENPQVEERHYKLWFASLSIMSRLQNVALSGRSQFKIDEAKRFAAKYAITNSHDEALRKLEQLRVVIITGEPGIGKSTLAEQLALQYALKGFEICCLADSVDEAEDVWKKEIPQFIYFDDFLGRNYLMALERNEDSHIVGLIKRIRNDPTKRFVLTSRTNVLNRGKALTDLFRIENVNRNEYELRVDALTLLDRARILYNHVWGSELDREYIEAFYTEGRYLKIAQHRNFNPRLISFVTDPLKVDGILASNYWQYIYEMLQNPRDVWAHVFDSQLGVAGRALVRLAVFNGSDLTEAALRDAYVIYQKEGSGSRGETEEFELALKVTVGSVLNRNLKGDSTLITLFNPSLGDFIVNRYKDSSDEIRLCLLALRSEPSLDNLEALWANDILSSDVFHGVVSFLVHSLINDEAIPLRYRIRLGQLYVASNDGSIALEDFGLFATFLFNATDDQECCGQQADLLREALRSGLIAADDKQWTLKVSGLLEDFPSETEFQEISQLIGQLSEKPRDELELQFSKVYEGRWRREIEDTVYMDGLIDDLSDPEKLDEAMATVRRYVEDNVQKLYVDIHSETVESILDACDVEGICERNRQSVTHHVEGPSVPTAATDTVSDEIAAIHDLFQRA